jgi:hypothetical protein
MSEEEQTESIVDALRASFDEISETEETETEESAEAQPEEYVEEDAPVEAQAESEEEEATEEPSDDEEPETVFQAPEHWSSELREQFDSLAPEAQQVLLERDKEFQRGYQEKAEGIAAIQQAIEPWKQVLAQRGITEDQAIRTLFAAQHQIESDPVNGILMLARNFGVWDQLQSQFTPNTDDDFTDPEVKALKQQLAELQSQIVQTNQGIQQQQTSGAQEELNKFVNAVDESGKPAHPHFDKVRELMAPLVSQGKSLEDAYKETVWSVPEYREQALKPKPQSEAEKAQKVKKAKKASRAIQQDGTAKSSDSSDESLSIDGELRQAWKELA